MSVKNLITTQLLILACLLQITTLSAQERIVGRVVHDISGAPLEEVIVSILGCNEVVTDQNGAFTINVSPVYQLNKTIEIFANKADYGFTTAQKKLTADLKNEPITIELPRNEKIGIVGTVYDYEKRTFLQGIKVSISSNKLVEGLDSPEVVTNAFGEVRIVISKRALTGNLEYADLIFVDPNGVYEDQKETLPTSVPFRVYLRSKDRPTRKQQLKVDGYKAIQLKDVEQGSIISIQATGNIKVGRWVGHSGPEGRVAGFANGSLEPWNIAKNFNHAALMYKLSERSKWKYCGSSCKFVTETPGNQYIYFQVNDNKQIDNSGHYNLEITIE